MIVLGILAFFPKAHATHSMGADLTYECVGGNSYKIRVSFYRDCIGINAPANVVANINSASCGFSFTKTLTPIPGTGQEITPLCPSAVSTCNGGVFTGIQEWVYEGIVTLPAQCTDWTFSYNLCCRNNAINTITTPTSSTFYIYATLNNTISPCNTSPVFSNKPVPFACLGQQFCFNHGATDADGDSLVYQLITPKQSATSNVNYVAPFSATNPLTSNPAVQFNTATGDICMTPQQLDVTVMAVLVKEYRNGVLIGTVERDIQVTVINCNNNLPTLTGINGTNVFSATICANQPYCFNIYSNDPDAGQNVFLSYDNSIGGATFSSAGSPHPTGTFCWTPTDADISATPHCFTVKVNDDACPVFGSQVYSYCITVVGVDVNAGADQYITCSDLATVTATASGGTGGPYTYLWSNGFTNPTQTVGAGTYVVTVSDGTCSSTDTVSVYYLSLPTANFTASPVCLNSPIPFTDLSTVTGSVITNWDWSFGDGATSTLQNPTHTYSSTGTYNVTLIVTTNLGCIDTIMQPITINPLPVVTFTVAPACAGTAVTINNTTVPPGSITNWNWNLGNGSSSGLQNPTVTYSDSGTYVITGIGTDANGCIDTMVQTVVIEPAPVAAFSFVGQNTCQGGSVTFNNNSTGNIVSWNWNLGNGQTSTQQNPSVVYTNPGTYTVTLTVTSANGCVSTLSQSVIIAPPPTVNAGTNQAVCIGQSVTLTATGGLTYVWSNGQTTNPITVSPSSGTTYTVTATDANGCTGTDVVNVTVNPLPTITLSPDQTICNGQSATLTASGGTSYYWNPTGNTTGTITVNPTSSTTYAVSVTNANGCTANGFVNVIVRPLPVVNIPSTFVCPGTSIALNAGNPGATYQWSTGATTQTISVSTAATYTVTVTNSYGCTASQQVLVTTGGSINNNTANVAFCQGQNATLNAGNPGNTYVWSTGATSQTINVTTAGQYAVTITNTNGCSATLTTTVNVNPLPNAAFTPHDVCLNEPVNFLDISTINSGTITGWQWSFGDGNVSQQQNPSHTYSNAGAYTITLAVTSAAGCTTTLSQPVNVYALPVANFTMPNACAGSSIHFTNSSASSSGSITSYQWSFGDGGTATTQSPNHTYSTAGIYNVSLMIGTSGGCTDTVMKQVVVYSLPDANFSSTKVCRGLATTFTDLSSVSGNNISTWHWDFGDGTTSTQQNPNHTYNTQGNFNAQLIVQTAYGCSDTVRFPVKVYKLPTADAGPNQNICRGISATLTGTGGAHYSWIPTGDTTASIQVTPTAQTWYYVQVTDTNGCKANDSVRVSLKNLPNANAGVNKTACLGNNVTLTASGGGSYLWLPGNQTTQSISVSPASTTNYIVIVTSANGCTNSDTANVKINLLPVAVAGSDQTICKGITTPLTASGGASYNWLTTGATTPTIYVNPQATTSYVVQVTDSNGCKANDTLLVTVNPVPTVNLTNVFFCMGTNTVMNAGNAGSTYLWSPTGETTQTILVSGEGTYGVIVTSPNGCTAYDDAMVVVGGDSIVDNTANVMVCQGATTLLDAGNPGSTYLWSTGATSQTVSVNGAGTYTVTITDGSGCSASFASAIVENPLPVPSFITSPTCLGDSSVFTNTSTIASGNIMSYDWNFGDGSNITALNPTHEYTAPGNYQVTLNLTSGNGCTANVTNQVTINSLPQVNFTSNTVCYGSATQFGDLSTVSNGTINYWHWNFGDGDTSTTASPAHNFANAGYYDVTLVAGSATGCVDSMTLNVTVNPSPEALFSANEVCLGEPTVFTDASSIINGVIDVYDWNFGDGNTSSLQNPTHTYANPGTYNVSLRVVSDMACDDVMNMALRVNPKPAATFTTPSVCVYNAASFNSQSIITTGNINNWYWNFGDNTSSNDSIALHNYAAPGSYTVALVVTSDKGCGDTATVSLAIFDAPTANFSGASACQNAAVQFNDSSSIATGNITNWNWIFSNGSSSAQQNPSVNFTTPGVVNAQLVVTSSNGCTDTASQSINVFDLPTATFTTADVCLGSNTPFYNQSSVNGGANFTCNWNFGDGTNDTLEYTQHTYAQAGNYNVQLTVTTNTGCVSTISQPVQVFAPPVANFSSGSVCRMQQTTFTDASSVANGSITSWNWAFGDGLLSQSQNPLHTYATEGTYPVQLTVTSNHGCTDIYYDTVEVYRLPEPQIATNPNCVNTGISMTDVSDTSSIVSWAWNFGDGATSTQVTPVHQYAQAGSYWITLMTENTLGCRATDSMLVDVYPNPQAGFTGGPGCEGSPIDFTNTSTIASGSITRYDWAFGDSTTSGAVDPTHTFTPAGNYNVTLVVTSDFGCVDSVTATVVVNPNPVAHFTFSDANGCGPLLINFTDSSYVSSGNVVSWYWNFGDGHTDTLQNTSNIYYNTGVYPVALTVTSDAGCVNTDTIPNAITVYPSPIADFTPDPQETTILYPFISFNNSSSGGNVYNWNFGDNHTGTGFEPEHAYGDTGKYIINLTVINTFGCIDTASNWVYIAPITTFYVPNAFTPNNDGHNEIFDIKGINIITYTLSVRDRWGEQVFYGEDHGWDGSVKGSDIQAKKDVYVYTVVAKDIFGQMHKKVGHVTLLR